MVEFSQSFFDDEIRDGFYVKSDMKRLWAAEIEVLMEIDRICKKYHISYYADFGTLLGAVRHNGFIPWDDDLDIVMMRNDYMKFLNVAGEELKPPFICANIYRSETWPTPFARVMNGIGINLDQRFLDRFHGCPYSAGADIFILDNMPESENEFYVMTGLVALAKGLRTALNKKNLSVKKEDIMSVEEIEGHLCQIEEICNVKIDRKKDIKHQLLRIIDGIGTLNGNNQSDEVFDIDFISQANYYYAGHKRVWYQEAMEFPFENIMIPVPVGYDEILQQEFGEYLKPVKDSTHDIYNRMERELKRARKEAGNIKEKVAKI